MTLREHAIAIWQAGVNAVQPAKLVADAVRNLGASTRQAIEKAPRIVIVGAGKAGAAMAEALEANLPQCLPNMHGLVNVPEGSTADTKRIRLHPARPAGVNFPTAAGVAGSEEMLRLLESSGPDDVAICLISGGGSALLPAPAEGITLEAKLAVTKLLHASGATIQEMNAVRKHLSRIKGGRLAQAFRGRLLLSFVISDVIGDPLDAIASGPTAPDPTTFAECREILEKFELWSECPVEVREQLEAGMAGRIPETLKTMPDSVRNILIGNNATALEAAAAKARSLGYHILNNGVSLAGEARTAGADLGLLRSLRNSKARTCILAGGETTVTLGSNPGKGGRNQEFVLAALCELQENELPGTVILSGGTDGEDGPTDAAGAIADEQTFRRMKELNLDPADFLHRHDAYPFFEATGGLLKCGLTGTNVMDVAVSLIE
jgi:hydroxypyruvate reductase/glycerate 2-kinase